LHAAAAPVGRLVVPKRGALPRNARPQRRLDRACQLLDIRGGERVRRTNWMDTRTPQRFVRIDVPHAGERPLIEQRRLDRRTSLVQSLGEATCSERTRERLAPDPSCEVRLELTRLDHEPRAEASHVAVRNIRSVV
jgi:hypothetical protein